MELLVANHWANAFQKTGFRFLSLLDAPRVARIETNKERMND